jgi:hypothetical protein
MKPDPSQAVTDIDPQNESHTRSRLRMKATSAVLRIPVVPALLLANGGPRRAAAEEPAPNGDPAALFKRLDSDGDGGLSKDELKRLAEIGQSRLKGRFYGWLAPEAGGKVRVLAIRGDGGGVEPARRTDAEVFVGTEQVFVIHSYQTPNGQVEVRRTAAGIRTQ